MTRHANLEFDIAGLSESIVWPQPPPDLADKVVARIASPDRPRPRTARFRVATAVAILLVVTVAMLISPATRQAVADLLQAAGVRIGLGSEPAGELGAGLDLGTPVSLDAAAHAAGFTLRVPAGHAHRPPDSVFLARSGEVTLAWSGDDLLPAAGSTGIAVLLTQHAASEPFYAEKVIGPETGVSRVTVEGESGLWVAGAPHTFTLLDPDGWVVVETTRLAANVLLWQVDGVSHRLEITGDLEDALSWVASLEEAS